MKLAILIALLIIAPVTNKVEWSMLPLSLDNVKFGMVFYIAGVCIKELEDKKKFLWLKKYDASLVIIVSAMLLILCARFNYTPVLMYKNEYGNYCLFYFGAFVGIYLLCYVSQKIECLEGKCALKRTFTYFGNTIWFYLMQFYVLDLVISIVIRINVNLFWGSILVFITTTLCLIPINSILKKVLKFD